MNYRDASLALWLQNNNKIYIPSQCDIDLTNSCNQSCYYCISAKFRNQQHIRTFAEYEQLLFKLNTWRYHSPNSVGTFQAVAFSGGGEPTLFHNYEKLIEKSIDYGFLTALTTNGIHLESLLTIDPTKLRKMNWIGVDLDAGNNSTYEIIRNSKISNAFDTVIKNARNARKLELPVDFKVLLNEYNSSEKELGDIFKIAKDVNIRQIYFRPAVLNNAAFDITPNLRQVITDLGKKFDVSCFVNITKTICRTYSRCYQMFNFPSFCADGNIYACCDFKGNPNFSIGNWIAGDFRDNWLSPAHIAVYDAIDTHRCPPCRNNQSNNNVEACLQDPQQLGVLHI